MKIKHLIPRKQKNISRLLCVAAFSSCSMFSYAQQQQVNLTGNNLSLKAVFQQIEKQTNLSVDYKSKDLNDSRIIRNVPRSGSVDQTLKQVLNGTNCEVIFKKGHIIIKRTELQQQKNIIITGKVKDSLGNPLIGANVLVKGTTNGTVTDLDGKFTLDIPIGVILKVSYIGYIDQEIKITRKNNLSIVLKENSESLEEVVVVGYGAMKKSDLTGSVVSLKAEEINSSNNSSLIQMLQGRAAGVNITQNNAQPGGAASIQIRGISSVNASSAPLYVIDGFPVDNTNFYPGSGDVFDGPKKDPLNSINPSDIENIEILKDASATAIYGSRAANGVILVTTKQGREGKAKVILNSSVGIQTIAKRFDFLNATDFAKFTNEIFAEYDKLPYYTDGEINSFGKGTDWFKEVTQLGIVTNHDLSIQGGTNSTKYMISGSYHLNKGIVKESAFERYSFRTNIEQKISSKINLNIHSLLSNTSDENVAYGTRAEDTGVLAGAYTFPSNIPVKDENDKFSSNPRYVLLPNPVSLLDIDDKTRSKRAMLNVSLDINPIKTLSFKFRVATDMQDAKREYYNPKTTRNGADAGGIASVTTTQGRSNLLEVTSTYKKDFGHKHKINAMLGYTYQDFLFEDFSAKVTNFFTDYFGYNNISIGETYKAPSTFKRQNKLLSGIARVNYNYDDRYLCTATFRADGSSKFQTKHRFGYFPSFSAAWRISNEKFMKELSMISNLKLRFGYGETGNQEIGDNSYQNLLRKGYEYIFGDSPTTTIVPANAGNPFLKWETAKQYNLGLDIGLFNNRITSTIELYQINTDNLLLRFSTPAYSGYTSQWRNAGEICNRGIEFSLRTVNIRNDKFEWLSTLTVSHNSNKWKDRAGLPKPYIGANQNDPVNAIYGYIFDGIWQEGDNIKESSQPKSEPGNIRFKDVGGRDSEGRFVKGPDGKLDDADICFLGTPDPKVEFGFGNDITYNKWNLSVFFNARLGGKKYNKFRSYYENPIRVYEGFNAFNTVLSRWTPSNTSSLIHSGAPNSYGGDVNTYYVENASFLRLKSLRLSYETKLYTYPISIFVEGQNLFTITKYSGYDPEIGGTTDFNTYPASRLFMTGFRVSF